MLLGASADWHTIGNQGGAQVLDNQVRKHIQKLAYGYWQERGSPIGSPEIDWFRAEQQIEEMTHSWHLREDTVTTGSDSAESRSRAATAAL
jgi:hypothetical protein